MEMVVSVPPKERKRDWAYLPPELIGYIAGKLKDYADNVRFRFVCRTWRTAPRVLVGALPPELPWLCLPDGKSANSTWYLSGCRFFSLSAERYYAFKPRGPSKKINDIPFDGRFIFTSTHKHVRLLNPITGSRISLPPLPGKAVVIRKASCVECHDGVAAGGFCVIVLGIKRTKKIFVYRSTDRCWNEFCDDRCSSDEDVTYYKESIIFATGISNCVRYDISTSNITPITIDGSTDLTASIWYKLLLVQSSSGDLFMVKFRVMAPENSFEVFRLVLTEQKLPMWSKVRSIGDDIIFMDYRTAVSINAGGFDRCRSNCIYFYSHADGRGNLFNVFLFNIENDRVEKVSSGPHQATSPHISWIVPYLC